MWDGRQSWDLSPVPPPDAEVQTLRWGLTLCCSQAPRPALPVSKRHRHRRAALQALTWLPAAHAGSASGPAGVRLTLVLALTVVLELT